MSLRINPATPQNPCKSSYTATGIRTRVSAVRGRRPSPLDDSGGVLFCRDFVLLLGAW